MNKRMGNNFIINIGRQLGSGGREIGEKLAARLGIDFYDKELIRLPSYKKWSPGYETFWLQAAL